MFRSQKTGVAQDVEKSGVRLMRGRNDGNNSDVGNHLFQRYKRKYVRQYTRKYARTFSEASAKARVANQPMFIPSLTTVRQRCLEHVSSELRGMELSMENGEGIHGSSDYARAMALLRDMDTLIKLEARRLKLEDPEYSGSRGLNVVHLEVEPQPGIDIRKAGHWLMLGKDFGEESRDIIDPWEEGDLSEYHQTQIKDYFIKFGGGTDGSPFQAWTHRTKSTIERCIGTLKYENDGRVKLRHKAARIWLGVLIFAVTALACFYGVGIIATNSTFSPTFQRYFFWIAIFWSLISSSLLSWVVRAFGGNKRDVVAALLSGLSIWLVVIQIGQTHLLTQLST